MNITYAIATSDNQIAILKPYAFIAVQELFKLPSDIAEEMRIIKEHINAFWFWNAAEHSISFNVCSNDDTGILTEKEIKQAALFVDQKSDDPTFLIIYNASMDSLKNTLSLMNIPVIYSARATPLKTAIKGTRCISNTTTTFEGVHVNKLYDGSGVLLRTRPLGVSIDRFPKAVVRAGCLANNESVVLDESTIRDAMIDIYSSEFARDDMTMVSLMTSDDFVGI